MTVREPSLDVPGNPFVRFLLATRPGFLLTTLVGCLLGMATASQQGIRLDASTAFPTLLLALLAHAGTNVLNDYYDALNGADEHNEDRLYPYTGGSRFIQNGVLTSGQTAAFGYGLLGVVTAGGWWLATLVGPGLLLFGAAGVFLGWAYSAPPFKFNSRGLGEAGVVLCLLLIVAGADFVQRREFALQPWLAGLPFALLGANILYINQFPDRRADEAAGKRHWVVRLGVQGARWGYLVISLLAVGAVAIGMMTHKLPALAWLSLAPLLLSAWAGAQLWRHAQAPRLLVPAIRATIAAALAHGSLLAAILIMTSHRGAVG